MIMNMVSNLKDKFYHLQYLRLINQYNFHLKNLNSFRANLSFMGIIIQYRMNLHLPFFFKQGKKLFKIKMLNRLFQKNQHNQKELILFIFFINYQSLIYNFKT